MANGNLREIAPNLGVQRKSGLDQNDDSVKVQGNSHECTVPNDKSSKMVQAVLKHQLEIAVSGKDNCCFNH